MDSNHDLSTMGQRLLALRRAMGLSQQMLADAADCSVATINRIEREREWEGVSTATCRLICEHLGCTMDWLAAGKGTDPMATLAGAPLDGIIGNSKPSGFDKMRVMGFSNWADLRYILLTDNSTSYRPGDVMLVDCTTEPRAGDDFAAMVDGEVQLLRLASDIGASAFVDRQDGGRTLFDPAKATWFGPICGTLSSKRLKMA
ncbi:helix-turn-helix protein [compost metagenome]